VLAGAASPRQALPGHRIAEHDGHCEHQPGGGDCRVVGPAPTERGQQGAGADEQGDLDGQVDSDGHRPARQLRDPQFERNRVAGSFVAVSLALAWWVASHPHVQGAIASPEQIRQLVDHDFKDYYSAHPSRDFAFQVWTNNAWVTALCIAFGAFLGLPVIWLQL